MAGPDVHFRWRMPVKCLHTGQADYKVRRELKTCLSEFHRILWCGFYIKEEATIDSAVGCLFFYFVIRCWMESRITESVMAHP